MDENLDFSCRRRNWLESFKPLKMKPWKWEFKQIFKKFVGVAIKEKFEKYETVELKGKVKISKFNLEEKLLIFQNIGMK